MKNSFKSRIAKATVGNYELNKKVLCLKRSWDEVDQLLRSACYMKYKKR